MFPGRVVGTTETLFFYPMGRDYGPEIRVPVQITSALCAQEEGCARDLIRLDIYDDRFETLAPGGVHETVVK